MSDEKCPKCNGVSACPEIPWCRGCSSCDFSGTMAGYLKNREAEEVMERERAEYHELKRKGVCPTCRATCPKEAEKMCKPHAIADTGDYSCAGEDLWEGQDE